ncbi:PREDICTED: coiled-coil domain-containing protein 50-like isoform X1 [Gekko japonicus]|uniref:Coiled-coil domain-containing protein 50-like isoform X1 n=1 Tax=Gekko japonicus TaxID=146911 RepID=A0ABM1JT46_GEKJA|nr:PREDICTED: coiled-coil domain-containing protein 50-like isoform X1 [Gekko japonicus]XP_015264633.1 PREDICTED: coiled-coil domain-containing protein 50-like isoform X1 [Gekko japonicus]XP_015264634.1 PREDICTED: coiled-coil domain-containing protein 50-like isoform X1 [Gekko japonicus]
MTEVQIDSSRLPPVQEVCRDFAVLEDGALAYCLQEQEIEQHYTSNIQKNQLVQKDIKIAKRLQGMEEEERKLHNSKQQKQIEESDSEIARAIQEDIQRKAEESRQREERDQELAKRLQDLEEEAIRQQKQRSENSNGEKGDDTEPLHWVIANLELQTLEQLRQDEELAQKLQEEEQTSIRARKNRERNDDYRAAQVAQDEEIARYMQEQELKAQWRSSSKDGASESIKEAHSLSERRWSRGLEEAQTGCGAASPARVQSLERSDVPSRGGHADMKPQHCRNIAEDLDPTFKAKRTEPSPDLSAVCSQAVGSIRPVPVDGLFDYMDEISEPTFVSPTKRQPEKMGRQKSRDKKEGCKQQ